MQEAAKYLTPSLKSSGEASGVAFRIAKAFRPRTKGNMEVNDESLLYIVKKGGSYIDNMEYIANIKNYIVANFNIDISKLTIIFDEFDSSLIDTLLRPGFLSLLGKLSESQNTKTLYTQFSDIGFNFIN
jgi:hypothetical protein